MTTTEKLLINACLEVAKDIAVEDDTFCNIDRDTFTRAMWQDDSDLKSSGLSREEYRDAIHDAWHQWIGLHGRV
jgi:hypothetical protein